MSTSSGESVSPVIPTFEATESVSWLGSKRLLAPLSLIIACIGFFATNLVQPLNDLNILKSFFEAAMIGGLADWFAVSALFRHPLGLPIPHTDIIRNSRKEIETAIKRFSDDLLTQEAILDHITRFALLARLKTFWEDRSNKELILNHLTGILIRIADQIETKRIAPLVAKAIYYLRRCYYAPKDSLPEHLYRAMLWQLNRLCEKPEISREVAKLIEKGIEKAKFGGLFPTGWFVKPNQAADKILTTLKREVDEELCFRPNMIRKWYDEAYKHFMWQLGTEYSNASMKVNAWCHQYVNSHGFEELIEGQLAGIRSYVVTDLQKELEEADRARLPEYYRNIKLEKDESQIRKYIEHAIDNFMKRLDDDPDFRQTVESKTSKYISEAVYNNRKEIGALLGASLARYTGGELVKMIETRVGPHLQYIRVNGAVIGGLVGVLLHLVKSGVNGL
jgi:uncharacterized membrane-anchored protein YjiN (DUF445 family)